jgi:copper chaperone NosL
MAEIKWDRETCPRCSMVISDRHFAAQLRGGRRTWYSSSTTSAASLFWLRDHLKTSPGSTIPRRACGSPIHQQGQAIWLDPRKAHYITRTSPMGYNFGAVSHPQPGSLDFAGMRQPSWPKESR